MDKNEGEGKAFYADRHVMQMLQSKRACLNGLEEYEDDVSHIRWLFTDKRPAEPYDCAAVIGRLLRHGSQ